MERNIHSSLPSTFAPSLRSSLLGFATFEELKREADGIVSHRHPMAKRSDLAQKLLDDIRLRKEKMGLTSSGQHSAQPSSSSNAYGNSRWSFRGSGEATASKSSYKHTPNTEVTKLWLNTRDHRTPSLGGPSHDIIPAGQTRSKEHNIDMSMALALALSNIGKLQNIELFSNAKVDNKFIMNHGSLSLRGMDGSVLGPSPDQFAFLSTLQIGEISKGVQNLNMILRACTNGINFTRNSVDIGRELLKGAFDLEESLRMLMSLQDASDYMVGSKGKQIKLLNSKEEDDSSSEVKSWKLIKPRFSFDGTSRHSNSLSREDRNTDQIKQKQLALAYPEKSKAPKLSSNKSSNSLLQFNSHRRSLSCSQGSMPDTQFLGHASKISHSEEVRNFIDGNSSSSINIKQCGPKGSSRTEKVRIPNVVAKLMGLEELPLQMSEPKKTGVQSTSKTKLEKESGKTMTPASEIVKKEVDKITYTAHKMKRQDEVMQEKGIVDTKATKSIDTLHNKGKKNMEDLNGPEIMYKASNYSTKPHLKFSKQMDAADTDKSKESKVVKKEAAEIGEKTSPKQQIRNQQVQKSADTKPIVECEAENTTLVRHEYSDKTVIRKEREQRKNDVVPKEQRNVHIKNSVVQKQLVSHQSNSKQTGHKSTVGLKYDAKVKLQTIIAKKKDVKSENSDRFSNEIKTQVGPSIPSKTVISRSSANSIDKGQEKEYLHSSQHEKQKTINRPTAYHEFEKMSRNEKPEERRPLLKSAATSYKEKPLQLTLAPSVRKPVQNPSGWETEATEVPSERKDNSWITVQAATTINNRVAEGQNLKQHTSFLLQLEHRWKERTSKGGAIVSSHSTNSLDHSQKIIPLNDPACSAYKDDCKRVTDKSIVTKHIIPLSDPACTAYIDDCKRTDQTIVTKVECKLGNADEPMQSRITTPIVAAAPESLEVHIKEDQTKGPGDKLQLSNLGSFRSLKLAPSEPDGQELLTQSEQALMQILLKNQHFLNTAQALFKTKIPIGVLQASESVCQTEGNNNILVDCAYEVIRRKSKREELIFGKRMSSVAQLRHLDALVKELNCNFDNLKFNRKIEGDDYDTAEFLHKMVEKDVQNRNPDVNSMWDFGWKSMMFASIEKEEIIRDVEKHLLNGLINDIAGDLMNVSTIAPLASLM